MKVRFGHRGTVREHDGAFQGVVPGPREAVGYRGQSMMASPDPRPGRWILPLVVVGMVLFTYIFVQTVPGSNDNGRDLTDTPSSTTSPPGETPSTTTTVPVDAETAAFLATVDDLTAQLTALQAEMTQVNAAWDADPRQIEYQAADTQLKDLRTRASAWAQAVAGLVPPAALAPGHATLVTTAQTTADAAAAIVTGFEGPDAQPRLDALSQFTQAVSAVSAAADQIRATATAAATATPTTTAG